MNLLVAGAAQVDAGKTTFALGLVAHTGAVGFKPRAGNDYWFSHGTVRDAVAEGRLYGKDARRLAAASPGRLAPEEINPVHRLWRPAPEEGTGLLGRADREFVLDRAGDGYVRNATARVPDAVREHLPVEEALVVESVQELNDAIRQWHLPAQATVARDVAGADRAVVESYGNVARPIRDLDVDAVAVVEPGRVRFYRGDRYAKACEVATGGRSAGQLETRVDSIVDLLEPSDEATLSPLRGRALENPEAIAGAYADRYERLLAVAAE